MEVPEKNRAASAELYDRVKLFGDGADTARLRYFAFLPNRSETSVIEMNACASMSWTMVRILAI